MLGQIAQGRGAMEQASALFEESLIHARKSGISHVLSAALGNYAQVAQAQGKLALATSLLEEALTVARANGSLWGEAVTQTHLGLLTLSQQLYPQARQRFMSALALYRTFGSDVYLAWCLEAVAALDTTEGNHARATAISAGAESLRASGHAPRPSGEQQSFERALAICHETLGDAAFEQAWKAGTGATRDVLIRLALGEETPLPL
jgi:tetratricopeptide (TPR) repeat protein